jgi:flavin reductase (DIM6/NTAB) family NADH-FMN oxidoreductase RutF
MMRYMHSVITPSVYYFGTPVALITTTNDDGASNISPMSSLWALGDTYVLGLGAQGHAVANLRVVPELVINLADASLARAVERIAPTTGANPVPAHKQDRYSHEPDKWTLGGLTPLPSDTVAPPRVAQCPVHLEAKVVDLAPIEDHAIVVQARVTRTHVRTDLVQCGTSYLDLDRWQPLYYTFRHYFAQGLEVGVSFKADQ